MGQRLNINHIGGFFMGGPPPIDLPPSTDADILIFHDFEWKTRQNILKNKYKSISAVPIDSKFYGESESDSPWIDLYSKIMSFHKKHDVEMGVSGANI